MEDRICPYCKRVFPSKFGRDIHAKKFVCRPELRAASKATSSAPTKDAIEPPDKSSATVVGVSANESGAKNSIETTAPSQPQIQPLPEFSRLKCMSCSQEFTSAQDRDYHVISFSCRPNQRQEDSRNNSSDDEPMEGAESENDDEEDESEAGDESGDNDEKMKGRRKRKRNKSPTSNSTAKEQKCQYCNKRFKNMNGLDYHIKNFVCRHKENPDGHLKKRKRRSITDDDNGKYRRLRGPLEERSCNICKRVFTSTLGLKYHKSKSRPINIAIFLLAISQSNCTLCLQASVSVCKSRRKRTKNHLIFWLPANVSSQPMVWLKSLKTHAQYRRHHLRLTYPTSSRIGAL